MVSKGAVLLGHRIHHHEHTSALVEEPVWGSEPMRALLKGQKHTGCDK